MVNLIDYRTKREHTAIDNWKRCCPVAATVDRCFSVYAQLDTRK